ncbi:MAG TPA: DUF4199 domain-containing protein [Bacteroidia bacterium]|nr:DUF4199 domain-containing protein [Bacteroidia bacterium]
MKRILIPGLILAAIVHLEYIFILMNILPSNGITALIFLLIDFMIFFLFLKWVKRKYYSNDITFKQVFSNGICIGVLATVLLSAFIFVFLSYIDRSVLETFKKMVEEESKQDAINLQGSISASDEKSIKALTPTFLALNSLIGIIWWILFSLISAPILKTKKPE